MSDAGNGKVVVNRAMSLDGFIAGPGDSMDWGPSLVPPGDVAAIAGDQRALLRFPPRGRTRLGAVMRGAVTLVLVGVLCLGACGGDEDDMADTSVASITAPRGGPVVIRTRMDIADTAGAEPIATGEVLEGSSLGDSPFCVGGTVRDSHGSSDPTVWLIVETITCPEGTVTLQFRPEPAQGLNQTGSWTFVSGTGAFERLRGSGEMEVVYGPDPESLTHVTFTGRLTR